MEKENTSFKDTLCSEVHLGSFVKCAIIVRGHKQQGLGSTDSEDRKDIS